MGLSETAELLNVGVRTIKRAKQVIKNGVPELQQQVSAGNIKVRPAADISKLPAKEQLAFCVEVAILDRQDQDSWRVRLPDCERKPYSCKGYRVSHKGMATALLLQGDRGAGSKLCCNPDDRTAPTLFLCVQAGVSLKNQYRFMQW